MILHSFKQDVYLCFCEGKDLLKGKIEVFFLKFENIKTAQFILSAFIMKPCNKLPFHSSDKAFRKSSRNICFCSK